MNRPDDECLEAGHDLTPRDDRPEVQQCSRCRCLFQDSGSTLAASIGDRDVVVPNSACIDWSVRWCVDRSPKPENSGGRAVDPDKITASAGAVTVALDDDLCNSSGPGFSVEPAMASSLEPLRCALVTGHDGWCEPGPPLKGHVYWSRR